MGRRVAWRGSSYIHQGRTGIGYGGGGGGPEKKVEAEGYEFNVFICLLRAQGSEINLVIP